MHIIAMMNDILLGFIISRVAYRLVVRYLEANILADLCEALNHSMKHRDMLGWNHELHVE